MFRRISSTGTVGSVVSLSFCRRSGTYHLPNEDDKVKLPPGNTKFHSLPTTLANVGDGIDNLNLRFRGGPAARGSKNFGKRHAGGSGAHVFVSLPPSGSGQRTYLGLPVLSSWSICLHPLPESNYKRMCRLSKTFDLCPSKFERLGGQTSHTLELNGATLWN